MSAVLRISTLVLRRMEADDLSAVMKIERAAYAFPWSEGIFRDCMRVGYGCLVYQQDGVIQAYGVMSVAAGDCHILNLCVGPQEQGRGLGRRVLAKMLDLARSLDADTAILEVRPSNRHAVSLYQSEGFNEVGRRKRYYPAGKGREDALIFAKSL